PARKAVEQGLHPVVELVPGVGVAALVLRRQCELVQVGEFLPESLRVVVGLREQVEQQGAGEEGADVVVGAGGGGGEGEGERAIDFVVHRVAAEAVRSTSSAAVVIAVSRAVCLARRSLVAYARFRSWPACTAAWWTAAVVRRMAGRGSKSSGSASTVRKNSPPVAPLRTRAVETASAHSAGVAAGIRRHR